MSEPRTKYPVKTSLEVTTEQDAFAATVAAHLTLITGKTGKRGVSKKSVWRLFNDHCQKCEIFLTSISMNENVSSNEGTQV